MGKHTQRKPGHLPKAAAGAAPVALLPTGPAPAPADPTLPLGGLPLDLRHDHSAAAAAGVADFPVSATSPLMSDTAGCGLSHSLTAVKSPNGLSPSQHDDVRFGSSAMTGHASDLHGSVQQGTWRPYDADTHPDVAKTPDSGRFTGDLRDGAGLQQSSSPAVDAGNSAAAVVNSEQRGIGHFVGSLDISDLDAPTPDSDRRHPAPADVGPVSGFLLATQSLPGNGFRGELPVDDAASAHATTALSPWLGPTQSAGASLAELALPPLV
ncbi:hypothetical protein [Amycolatopsis sp. FDAARGOS 1241]|uniref:hypothetical protein n=1 Tax=Amycolatopsis sp. FDAARGOS 1241 TaxID=2778070 RepID=UPI00194F0922|nr:hypothetical protein [Amycolatopsis sp. FDAARGOS 1241]QRP51367.1 hypothetical protein I6J71_45640 [Amycolatopsis sp. FDAARGOS 1241]